jgi:hypothetical protein
MLSGTFEPVAKVHIAPAQVITFAHNQRMGVRAGTVGKVTVSLKVPGKIRVRVNVHNKVFNGFNV